METPKIRYNVRERGRKHTGQNRNFDVRKLCDAINSDYTQETVESGGMLGYYGHMPRVRYGMIPQEGGIENGKYAPVEPAFVTTYLRADYDGNIEHKARFIDSTASGQLARKLWEEKIGGFSSAIDASRYQFFGFDYVNAPNFLQNSFRGVVLDDVTAKNPLGLTYDDIYAAEQQERDMGTQAIVNALQSQRNLLQTTILNLEEENEQLLSLLASRGINPHFGGEMNIITAGKKTLDDSKFMKERLQFQVQKLKEGGVQMPESYNRLASQLMRHV